MKLGWVTSSDGILLMFGHWVEGFCDRLGCQLPRAYYSSFATFTTAQQDACSSWASRWISAIDSHGPTILNF